MKSIEGHRVDPGLTVVKVSICIMMLTASVWMFQMAIKSYEALAQATEEKPELLIVVAEDGTCLVTRDTLELHSSYTSILNVWGETAYQFSESTHLSWIYTYKSWQWAAERLGADPESCEGDATLDE